MRLSYKWLQEYVDLSDITPQQLADRLTTAGLEVEGIEPMAQGTGLVIAEVIECEDIPDTHLHRTIVRYGAGENDHSNCMWCRQLSIGFKGNRSFTRCSFTWNYHSSKTTSWD